MRDRLPYCSNFLNINDNVRYWRVRESEGRVSRKRRGREGGREGGKVPDRKRTLSGREGGREGKREGERERERKRGSEERRE